MTPDKGHVLVIEDSEAKFVAICSVLQESVPSFGITRAATMVEAELYVETAHWDLVILDISMDIAPSTLGARSRGQANIGGLGIAQKMFLIDREAPTIILTAYDSFSTTPTAHRGAEIVGFEEVEKRATQFLPNSLLGCIQYTSDCWRDEMKSIVIRNFP